MRLREPFVRKHICAYTATRTEYATATDLVIERTCEGCDKVQVTRSDSLPLPLPIELFVYADVPWIDGTFLDVVDGKVQLPPRTTPLPPARKSPSFDIKF